MKTNSLLLVVMFFIASINVYATVRTVSNHTLGGAQYATLKAAYDASSNNDTLLLEGTDANYSIYQSYNNNWNKSLVVIGQGLNTDKENFKQVKMPAAGIYWLSFISGATGSKFYGISFTGGGPVMNGGTNILFENCQFESEFSGNFTGCVFRNCIFTNSGSNLNFNSSASNVLLSSCIFNGTIVSNGSSQLGMIDHCLFLGTGACFSNFNGSELRNSIFMNSTGVSGITGSTFQNNLIRLTSTFPPAGNTDNGGNIIGSDPLFTTYTDNALYANTQDYHLLEGSPALAAASDGTEIGLHGGYSNFSESGEVLIVPIVRTMNVPTSTAPVGGSINVEVEASKPTDN